MPRRQSFRLPALALIATVSCTSRVDIPTPATGSTAEGIAIRTRFSVSAIGPDTLSSMAIVTRLAPEPDGESIAFIVADPARRLRGVLGLLRAGDRAPGLLWPDSVRDAWWSRPHFLAFTTESGRGVLAVVDVHAGTAAVSDPDSASQHPGNAHPARTVARPTPEQLAQGSALLRRSTGMRRSIDVTAAAQRSPDGRWLAVHGARRTWRGQLSEPVWLIIESATGHGRIADRARTIDSLPALAAGWTNDGRFIYARGREIREITPAP